MTTTEMTAAINTITGRLDVLEAFQNSSRLIGPDGVGERRLANTLLDMEISVSTLINDPLANVKCLCTHRVQDEGRR